jgi:peptidoglycan LD-endopeptidase LytH
VRRHGAAVILALSLALGACSPSAGGTGGSDLPPPTFVTPDASGSSPASSVAGAPASASPSPGSSAPGRTTAGRARTYAFPVIGRNSYAHTHHDYPATDLISNCGNRVVAVTTGTILAVTRKDVWKPSVNAGATRGGLSVSLLGADGVRYYGSHLSAITAGIEPGVHVRTAQTLGRVGETGDASACHLHFGISPPCARTGDWWIQRGTVYPWRYLDAWVAGRNTSPATAVSAWKARHGCPKGPLVDP